MAFDPNLLSRANQYGFQLPQWVVDQSNDPNNPNAQAQTTYWSDKMNEMVTNQDRRAQLGQQMGVQTVHNGGGALVNQGLHPEAQFFNPTTQQQANPYTPTQPTQAQANPYMQQTPTAPSRQTALSAGVQTPGIVPPVGMENPYMKAQADAMTQQVAQNFNQQIAPSIRRNAMLTGGFGGARQGIAEGMAAQGAQQALSNSLAGLYGQGYNTDRQYDLGLGGLAATNRGLDLQQTRLGGDLFTQGIGNAINIGDAMYRSGNQEMMAPWSNAINPYLNSINLLAGNSGTTTTGQQTGGGWTGALGGALSGAQLAKWLFGG